MAENNEIVRPAELELVDGGRGNVPAVFHLNQKQITIGRGPANAYIWRWENVSRRHVAFEYQDSKWLIKDMSANGIKLNDNALPKDTFVPLKNDDLVTFKVGFPIIYRFKCYDGLDDAESDDENQTLYETVLSTLSCQGICPLTQGEHFKKKMEGGGRQPLTPTKSQGDSKLFSLLCGIASKNLWGNKGGPQLQPEAIQGASKYGKQRQDDKTKQTDDKHDAEEEIEYKQYLLKIKEQREQICKLQSEIQISKDIHRSEVNKLEQERRVILQKQAMFRIRTIEKVLKCFDEIKCAICTDVIVHQAEIIDCGHTFCGECLIMRNECPKCKHPITGAINSYALQSYMQSSYFPLITDDARH